jgi:hypothetical protein
MGITKQVRATKREAAEKRQAEYDKLTLEQKLARAGAKEKAKLLKKSQK